MPTDEKKQAAFQATEGMWRVVYIRPPRASILVRYPGLRRAAEASGPAAWLPRFYWGVRRVELPGSPLDGQALVELVARELDRAECDGFELHGELTFTETFGTPQRRSLFRVHGPGQAVQTGGLVLFLRRKNSP